MTDADGVIPLAVGSNVITIKVTAEDGETSQTYTVAVTRAEAPPEMEPEATATVDLSPSGPVTEGTETAVTMTFTSLALDSEATWSSAPTWWAPTPVREAASASTGT